MGGVNFRKQFEILVDEDGNLQIQEQQDNSNSFYNERFIDSDGDGFVDADEILIGTDRFDFRSYPTDIDRDGILISMMRYR